MTDNIPLGLTTVTSSCWALSPRANQVSPLSNPVNPWPQESSRNARSSWLTPTALDLWSLFKISFAFSTKLAESECGIGPCHVPVSDLIAVIIAHYHSVARCQWSLYSSFLLQALLIGSDVWIAELWFLWRERCSLGGGGIFQSCAIGHYNLRYVNKTIRNM